jgi:hypothetical protein
MFRWYLADGAPVSVGGVTVTPHSRVLSVNVGSAAFVWQSPWSITIDRDGAAEERRVIDITRVAQMALLLLAVLFTLRSRA